MMMEMRENPSSSDLESTPSFLRRVDSYQQPASPYDSNQMFSSLWRKRSPVIRSEGPPSIMNPLLLATCIVVACILMVLFCYEFGAAFEPTLEMTNNNNVGPSKRMPQTSDLPWFPPRLFRMEYDFVVSDETGANIRGHSIFHYDYSNSSDFPRFRGDEVYDVNTINQIPGTPLFDGVAQSLPLAPTDPGYQSPKMWAYSASGQLTLADSQIAAWRRNQSAACEYVGREYIDGTNRNAWSCPPWNSANIKMWTTPRESESDSGLSSDDDEQSPQPLELSKSHLGGELFAITMSTPLGGVRFQTQELYNFKIEEFDWIRDDVFTNIPAATS